MSQRAAVLIGVSRTGGLPELQAVQSGIARMRDWAATQGIGGDRLVVLTDDGDKVRAHKWSMRSSGSWRHARSTS